MRRSVKCEGNGECEVPVYVIGNRNEEEGESITHVKNVSAN